MRISDWSSDVCSSDLREDARTAGALRVEYGARRRRTATRDEGIGVVDLGDIPCTPDREGQPARRRRLQLGFDRSEEHTSELQSLMRISYAVFCLKKKTTLSS